MQCYEVLLFLGLHAMLLANRLFMYIPCMQVYTEIIKYFKPGPVESAGKLCSNLEIAESLPSN